MNRANTNRDDSLLNRLSSFLKSAGELDLTTITKIKAHVYKIQTKDQKKYMLKRYKAVPIVKQQWEFFNAISSEESNKFIVPFIEFPNGEKWINDHDYCWVIMPYVEGSHLKFQNHDDRTKAVEVVQKLHRLSSGIVVDNFIIKNPLYVRMKQRLERFQETKHLFVRQNELSFYSDLLRSSHEMMHHWQNLDWYEIEKKATDSWSWIHGDVAAHNFIKMNSGEVKLIDFDLLTQSPSEYDWIQLAQRFLVATNWDFEEITKIAPFEELVDNPFWLLGIAFPADILREWLHTVKRKGNRQNQKKHLEKMQLQWHKRELFVKELNYMLR